jgi:hypothetical protein
MGLATQICCDDIANEHIYLCFDLHIVINIDFFFKSNLKYDIITISCIKHELMSQVF